MRAWPFKDKGVRSSTYRGTVGTGSCLRCRFCSCLRCRFCTIASDQGIASMHRRTRREWKWKWKWKWSGNGNGHSIVAHPNDFFDCGDCLTASRPCCTSPLPAHSRMTALPQASPNYRSTLRYPIPGLLIAASKHALRCSQVEPLSSHLQNSSFPTRQPSSSSPHRLLRQTLPTTYLALPLPHRRHPSYDPDDAFSEPAEPLASTILPPSRPLLLRHNSST